MLPTTVDEKATRANARRGQRFAARHTLWSQSRLPRSKNCGRAVQRNGGGVVVKVLSDASGRRPGFGNLQSCGSVWACPCCSATINAQRQTDIEAALTAWQDGGPRGRRVALVTLTMKHRRGQRLSTLWDALASSWNLVASGAGWAADQKAYGSLLAGAEHKSGPHKGKLRPSKMRIPVIRVVEGTHGKHGWHVHIHALLLLPAGTTEADVAALGAGIFDRWSAALTARGLSAQRFYRDPITKELLELGVDARLIKGDASAALGDYFTKAVYQGSMEVARGDMKDARYGNRTPFKVLADVVDKTRAIDDSREDLALWGEWELASKGRRQITWSRGLRALLLPDAPELELTDQELADQDHGGDVVAEVGKDLWALIVARRADWRLLQAFGRSDRNGYRLLWLWAKAADLESAAQWAVLAQNDTRATQWRRKLDG